MADNTYKNWEKALKALNDADATKPDKIKEAKDTLFNLNSDDVRLIPGRFIHDDHRIVLSAPEIIIGNVNMGGILVPGNEKGTIIIRGHNIAVEGSGDAGAVSLRAPLISQTAENPGVDGMEHDVKATSKIVSQARGIILQSDDVPVDGAFRTPKAVDNGGIAVRAESNLQLTAQKSCTTIKDDLQAEIDDVTTKKGLVETEIANNLTAFTDLRKGLDDLAEKRKKILDKDEDALRIDYRDLDEINIRIDEVTLELSKNLYEYNLRIAELKGLLRKIDSLTKQKAAIKDDKFKTDSTNTSITIASEKVSISSSDGDGNIRTNDGAGITIASNDLKVQSALDDQGSLEATGQMSVNMRNVLISTASKKVDPENANHIEYKSEGDVVITSKNIKLQSTDSETEDGVKFTDKGLTNKGRITIRSKGIGLSTVNTTDYKCGDDNKISATYTPVGKIDVFTKEFNLSSAGSKVEDGKVKLNENDLVEGSKFLIRTETTSISSSDKEGKATGEIKLNAKKVVASTVDVDPKTSKFKQTTEGGMLVLGAENTSLMAEKKVLIASTEDTRVIAKKTLSLRGNETAELKQDKGLLTISGGDTTLSGGKNTLHGETTINVLQSPSVTADNLTISKALKAPNFTDSVMVDTKNKSGASAKIDDSEEDKNDPNKDQVIPGAAITDEEQKKAAEENPAEVPVDHAMQQKMSGKRRKKKNKK